MVAKRKKYPFIEACYRRKTGYTPIWLMRQAGRYLKEYRDVRKKYSFMEMCKNPELSAEVTLLPTKKLDLDAAIIFSDILLPLEPMGIELEYSKKDGPQILRPIREIKQIERLKKYDPKEELHFLLKAIKIVREELDGEIPLIGFSGAPFTLASYMIEGGHSKNYILTKGLMYRDFSSWDNLMSKLSEVLIEFLNAQIDSGVQALQLFDSWVGCLSPSDYERYVLPYSKRIIERIKGNVPVIHFATSSSTLLNLMKDAGGEVIGVDWRIDLVKAWETLGYETAIQGNLDPVVLLGSFELIERETKRIIDNVRGRPGHIFNLGHGVLPNTPFDNVKFLIEFVHEYSSKYTEKE